MVKKSEVRRPKQRPGWERQPPVLQTDVELGGEGDQRKPLASLYGTRPATPGLKWTAR
jgi:hypothetical protein